MSWFEYTQRVPSTGDGGFYFFERTGRGLPVSPPLNEAYPKSWVVGGERGGGPIMVEKLPVEAFHVNGIPVYYEPTQNIWFVNGYPNDFASAAEATAFAESLLPSEVPPLTEPSPLATIMGIGAIIGLMVL